MEQVKMTTLCILYQLVGGKGWCQRWARKLFLKSSNRKSAISWAHSAIATSANLLGVPVRILQIPKFSFFIRKPVKYCPTLSQNSTKSVLLNDFY